MNHFFISFSDTAKFGLIGKEILNIGEFTTTFNFWNPDFFNTSGILPVYPYILSFFFRLFGVGDNSILIASLTFFVLSSIIVYLLISRMINKISGFFASVAFLLSPQIIDFSKSGASEIAFILEMLLGFYFVTLKNKWSNIGAILTMIALYFTRPQAFIYILGLIIFYFFVNFNQKKAIIYSLLSLLGFVIIDITLLAYFNGKYFIYSTLARGVDASVNHLPSVSTSDSLRGGGSIAVAGIFDVFKKLFYNLYNFYKAIPDIFNPYLFTLFILGMFSWGKNKLLNSFKISSLFMVLATLFVTAITIPFYRYIHPVIPFVYIIGVITLFEIVEYFVSKYEVVKNKKVITNIIASALVLFFAVGQTIGILVLDSRFERKTKNVDKPPIYVLMSWKLKEITNKDDVIVTNLDTWGSWYGERKTIWFPLEPQMMLDHKDKIDAIYLTSYKIDDENYYMGEQWREIFENPEKQTVLPDYKFVDEFEFVSNDNYEREEGKSVLLVRK